MLRERYGLTREDMSFADIRSVLGLYATSEDPEATLLRSIEDGRKRYEITRAIALPPLISSPQDVWYVRSGSVEPNFITQQSVRSRVMSHEQKSALNGAIVMIPSADPGFDWLFSHGIGGLITAYGGVNSHMAIRAGELRIPAVIGAGEVLFERWSRSQILHIDCANKKVEIIR
jgi:phosphohistidine swiveling domain-containing protein